MSIARQLAVVPLLLITVSAVQADVTTTLRRGRLSITGDGDENHIRVLVSDRVYVWTDKDEEEPDDDFPLGDVDEVRIRTRGAADCITAAQHSFVPLTGFSSDDFGGVDLDLNSGSGDDEVSICGCWRETKVVTGGGSDSITIGSAKFTGECTFKTGGGGDSVSIGQHFVDGSGAAAFGGPTTYFDDDLILTMGGGDDYLSIGSVGFDFPSDDRAASMETERVVLNGNAGMDCLYLSTHSAMQLLEYARSFEDCDEDIEIE